MYLKFSAGANAFGRMQRRTSRTLGNCRRRVVSTGFTSSLALVTGTFSTNSFSTSVRCWSRERRVECAAIDRVVALEVHFPFSAHLEHFNTVNFSWRKKVPIESANIKFEKLLVIFKRIVLKIFYWNLNRILFLKIFLLKIWIFW